MCLHNLYSGEYLHADKIWILATSVSSLQAQISQVLDFASNSFLQLNPTKCKIVSFAQRNSIDNPVCEIEGKVLTASSTGKCLGYLWNHDLSAKPSIDHNIMKVPLRRSPVAVSSFAIDTSSQHHIGGLVRYRFSPQSAQTRATGLLERRPYFCRHSCLARGSWSCRDDPNFHGDWARVC